MTAFARQRVVVSGPFDTVSGYGNDLCGIALALNDMGADVHLHPTSVVPPIPPGIAQLMCKPIDPPYDLAIVHRDPAALIVPPGLRKRSHKVVGWTMWEWDRYDDEERTLAERLREFDLLLTYDKVSYDAIDPHTDAYSPPHRILQGGYDSTLWKPIEREWTGTFRFGMVGRLTDRKNPFAAIKAFALLNNEYGDAFDAELHLKTNERTFHPAMEQTYPGLKIHYEWWSQKQLEAFYAGMHVLLAPSRGEGKNVPALEAMTTGIPVIATDIGGHSQWLSEAYAWSLTPYLIEQERGRCADVDVEELASHMFDAYTQRDVTKRKGDLAARTIPNMLDWEKVLERLGDLLKDIQGREPITL